MKRLLKIRNSLLLIFCWTLAAQTVAARTFRAVLPQISTASFYRVALPPHAGAVDGPELQSLRLINAGNQEQPYVMETFAGVKIQQLALPHDYVPVPVAGFTQVDSSDKHSYIRIRFDEAYPLDRLKLRFDGPRFYSRIITLPEAMPDWQRRIHQGQEPLLAARLRTKEVLLVVANDDNPPLRLTTVQASQRARYIAAWLEPGTYRIEYSDTGARAPRYDLVVLADSLSRLSLPILSPGPPRLSDDSPQRTPLPAQVPEEELTPSLRSRSVLTWCVIGVLITALIFATRALARRIGPENEGS